MAGFWNKVSGVFFTELEEDKEQEAAGSNQKTTFEGSLTSPKEIWQEPEVKKSRKGQLVSIPTNPKAMEMVLVKAESYDDMQNIALHIKDRRVVIVNFEDLPKETAQRMVDFLSGAVFALDGMPKKVSAGTFLFSSSNVDLAGEIIEETEELQKKTFASSSENESKYNFWSK